MVRFTKERSIEAYTEKINFIKLSILLQSVIIFLLMKKPPSKQPSDFTKTEAVLFFIRRVEQNCLKISSGSALVGYWLPAFGHC